MTIAINHKLSKINIPPFRILGNKYSTPVVRFTKTGTALVSVQEISDLTMPILVLDSLTFDLSFPFDNKLEFTIYSASKGFTRQSIIDEIRRAYRAMFRQNNKPASKWECIDTKDGTKQYHVTYPHSSLFVDQLFVDKENKQLVLSVEGYPDLDNCLDLPF